MLRSWIQDSIFGGHMGGFGDTLKLYVGGPFVNRSLVAAFPSGVDVLISFRANDAGDFELYA
eukprot:2821326-Pyramimonas_sp.AAC.1